ncbi:MAG: glycosyltransferase family 2 protein [Anaerolineae bacterium]|nr:glycosyltransferase family 2 protein [Anaerolineae bacterium]
MDLPTVSVVVLSYNSAEHVHNCFASLQNLDYPTECLDLVLADNASTDGSAAYVREHFAGVRIIEFDQNYGFCAGNNRAAALVESKFVAFLNPDMRVEPGWLKGLLAALDNEPGVVCASSKVLAWNGKTLDFAGLLLSFVGHCRADGYGEHDLSAYDDVRYILGPIGGAMLIDREILVDVGGFDQDFVAYFDDVDLGWRLWLLGYKVVFAPQSICYHVHYGSFSRERQARIHYLYERNALYTIVKNYEQQYLDRVLPVALLLHAKRAYLYSVMGGVDMEVCRFRLAPPARPAPQPVRYDARYYWAEAWKTLRQAGLLGLARQVLDELDRRRGRPVAQIVSPAAEAQQTYSEIGHAYLAAANDVIDNYRALEAKRAHIQARRQRSDLEIFSTVRALSFDVCFDTPEYRRVQQRLIQLFDIPELFGAVYDPDVPFAL